MPELPEVEFARSVVARRAELGPDATAITPIKTRLMAPHPHRHPGGACPRDGVPLARGTINGRTTWWCPREQKAAPEAA